MNAELIRVLKKRTPEKENTVDLLMDLVPIGKEAAYRRLRGDIPFTLEEAVTICKRLNLSLDVLAGTKQDSVYAFHSNAVFSDKTIDEYIRSMKQIVQTVEYLRHIKGSMSYRANRTLSHDFIFKYDSLSRIYLRIMFYQLYLQITPRDLLQIQIPQEVFNLQRKISSLMHDLDSVLILDKHIFVDYINIVKYFQGLGMIHKDDMAEIKRDMLLLIDDFEKCASTGRSLNNMRMDMYVSHISFDCSYTYIEGGDIKACSVGVYCIDHLSSDNPKICEKNKNWIKSLVRFSTLISISGELQRNEYFSEQRDLINSMI